MDTGEEQHAIQARRSEMEARFRHLERDIFCQIRIVADLEKQGRKNTGARIALRLMKNEQELALQELGHNPTAAQRRACSGQKPSVSGLPMGLL